MTSGDLGPSRDVGQEELDFSDLFLYQSPGGGFSVGCGEDDDSGALSHNDSHPPLLVVDHHPASLSSANWPASSQNLLSHRPTVEHLQAVSDSLDPASRPGTIPAPSPRIEITPWDGSLSSHTLKLSPVTKAQGIWRECVSPASSNSSTGWPAEACSPAASPCISPANEGCGGGLSSLDLSLGLQGICTSSAHSSPGASPRTSVTDETFLVPKHQHATSSIPHQRSRSASPHGKRCYDQTHFCQGGTPVKQRSRSTSPIPSPHELQGSYYLHQYQAPAEVQRQAQTPTAGMEDMLSSLSSSLSKAGPSALVHDAHGQAKGQDCVYGEECDWAIEQERTSGPGAEVKSETLFMHKAVWPLPHPVNHGAFCALPAAPLPSLDWPLPSQSGQYELLIKEQPRSHHRARYETEGSRGAIKTSNGGHPEVQLHGYQGMAPLGLQVFIGTADERLLKPHAFYEVHSITGKAVATPSVETMTNGTKVLVVPLEPKNLMRVVIDCVGILKLKNADIELRNGETDIGRKNTRVRLVFRVHIPQPGGQLTSLQVTSDPIECSQRSAQELPAVERQDLDQCAVLGGQQLVLTGQNFTADSKVVFSEKTQHGRQIWEVEATLDRNKTQANMLFVEVPPYRDQNICHPAKVNFYVINGKKKCSQPQHFIYTPAIAIKAEPLDEHLDSGSCSDSRSLTSLSVKSLYHRLEPNSHPQAFNIPPTLFHLPTVYPRAHMLAPDDQPAHSQSRTSTLTSSSMFYHTANQHYSNLDSALLCGSPLASHPASTPSRCDGNRAPAAELVEGHHVGVSFEACMMSRHQSYVQKALPLGKSPPSRGQVEPGGQCPTQFSPGRANQEEGTPESVTAKQENLHYSYLEDVNDIIRRDLKDRSDAGGLQQL